MKLWGFAAVLVFGCFSLAVSPTPPPAPVAATASAENLKIAFPVVKFKLDNGLTVLLHEDHSVPMVSYHTWYRVGSRDEQPGTTGAAHMLEHMMFKGAKKYTGKQFDAILHANGITNNAFTTWDYTGFYENLPSDKIEMMMDIEVDRMRFLALRAEDLNSELEVVKEERRWRVDNNPSGLLREHLFGLAYEKHPYHWPVIGTMDDITHYTPEKLHYFYDKFYVPNNAVLVIAGDIDVAKTKALVQKYYGALQASKLADRHYPAEALPRQARREIVKSDVQSPTVMLAYPGVRAGDPDAYALDLLANLLGTLNSSRLYEKMVYHEQLATGVGAFNMTNADPGLFMASAGLKPNGSIAKAERMLRQEIMDLKKHPPTAMELQKAKSQVMKDYVEGLTTVDGKAQSLAINEILFGSYEELFRDLPKYQAVTLDDMKRVIAAYLRPEREMVEILEPKKGLGAPGQGAPGGGVPGQGLPGGPGSKGGGEE